MGLTIHYGWRVRADAARARELVHALRREALELPFESVGEVKEISGDRARGAEDSLADWIRVEAAARIEAPDAAGETRTIEVPPLVVFRFPVQPEGAETAVLGLASHPATIEDDANSGSGPRETGLAGLFSWRSSCKTQYAGLPARGGPANFLKSHVTLIELLDRAIRLGLDVEVDDEGSYWKERDPDLLLAALDAWNARVAAVAGLFKDAFREIEGGRVVSPITTHPAFEHLEARGREEMKESEGQDELESET